MSETTRVHHYFVDEAGDMTLFGKRGKTIIGTKGVSSVFMVGVADLPQPALAREYLGGLRTALLGDPYFAGVPSMQPASRKTSVCFHACKDTAEVRYEVFKLLPRLNVKVQVAIRRKSVVAERAQAYYRKRGKSYVENYVYDDLVKRLFKNLQHKPSESRIVFARRGKSLRTEAFVRAIARAKENFERGHQQTSTRPTRVLPAFPREFVGLQVIDYYLWALQRLYERGEDRFFNVLASDYRLIMDLDDTRHKDHGEYYSDSNPLTLEKIKPVAG